MAAAASPVGSRRNSSDPPEAWSTAAPSLASEIGAVGSVNLSCFIRDWNPELQNNQGNAPARLCTTVQLPVEGNVQFSPIELRYVYDPQADDTTDDNKAKALLTIAEAKADDKAEDKKDEKK